MGAAAIATGLTMLFFHGLWDAEEAHYRRTGVGRPPAVCMGLMLAMVVALSGASIYSNHRMGEDSAALDRQMQQMTQKGPPFETPLRADDADDQQEVARLFPPAPPPGLSPAERARFEQFWQAAVKMDQESKAQAPADADPAIRAIMDETRAEIQEERAAMASPAQTHRSAR